MVYGDLEGMPEKIKVIVADDHPVFRKGLKYVISQGNDFEVIGEAECSADLLDLIPSATVDIVTLDVVFAGEQSLDCLKKLKGQCPDLPVLVLSMYPEECYALRYIKAGASGYICKDRPLEELTQAIRKVAEGGRFVSQEFMEKLTFAFNGKNCPPHELLSDREFQVFQLICKGRSLTRIAEDLCLSVKTISTHRGHILEKMKMESNAELIQYALLNGLL